MTPENLEKINHQDSKSAKENLRIDKKVSDFQYKEVSEIQFLGVAYVKQFLQDSPKWCYPQPRLQNWQ